MLNIYSACLKFDDFHRLLLSLCGEIVLWSIAVKMPDPITSFAIAGNVLQFVDFGIKLFTKSHEIHQRGSTRTNDGLEALTQDLADFNQYLQKTSFSTASSSSQLNDNQQVNNLTFPFKCRACVDLKLRPFKISPGIVLLWPRTSLTASTSSKIMGRENVGPRCAKYRLPSRQSGTNKKSRKSRTG